MTLIMILSKKMFLAGGVNVEKKRKKIERR